jgi:hypothetical protein
MLAEQQKSIVIVNRNRRHDVAYRTLRGLQLLRAEVDGCKLQPGPRARGNQEFIAFIIFIKPQQY